LSSHCSGVAPPPLPLPPPPPLLLLLLSLPLLPPKPEDPRRDPFEEDVDDDEAAGHERRHQCSGTTPFAKQSSWSNTFQTEGKQERWIRHLKKSIRQ
jgi:hypothetical protein